MSLADDKERRCTGRNPDRCRTMGECVQAAALVSALMQRGAVDPFALAWVAEKIAEKEG